MTHCITVGTLGVGRTSGVVGLRPDGEGLVCHQACHQRAPAPCPAGLLDRAVSARVEDLPCPRPSHTCRGGVAGTSRRGPARRRGRMRSGRPGGCVGRGGLPRQTPIVASRGRPKPVGDRRPRWLPGRRRTRLSKRSRVGAGPPAAPVPLIPPPLGGWTPRPEGASTARRSRDGGRTGERLPSRSLDWLRASALTTHLCPVS